MRGGRRWVLPAVLVLLGSLGLMGGVGTYAYWNDTAAIDGTTVYSGTLDLTVNGAQGNPTPYSWTALTLSTIAPGESTAAALTLTNVGTTPFVITATATASGALASYVTARVVLGGTASTNGTYPRSGSCSGTSSYNTLLSGTPASIVPNGTTGATLAAGASTTLCVSLTLSAATPNSAQAAAFIPSFSILATQA